MRYDTIVVCVPAAILSGIGPIIVSAIRSCRHPRGSASDGTETARSTDTPYVPLESVRSFPTSYNVCARRGVAVRRVAPTGVLDRCKPPAVM